MATQAKPAHIYRQLLREVSRSSKTPYIKRDKTISNSLRALVAKERPEEKDRKLFSHDIQNVITFMKSQREHKILVERYNPLSDLTKEEKIHATARRVGLDMPVTHTPEEK